MPECDTILAHLVVHLAETKKSVRVYKAYNKVSSGNWLRKEQHKDVQLIDSWFAVERSSR